jgi:hypothetical protein
MVSKVFLLVICLVLFSHLAFAAMTNYEYYKDIEIGTTHSLELDTNYTVEFHLDTATLISAGKMQNDCDDLRIYDVVADVELDRHVDKCNTADTNVLFRLQRGLLANEGDSTSYRIYYKYGSAVNPPEDLNKVYYFYDAFDDDFLNTDIWTFDVGLPANNDVLENPIGNDDKLVVKAHQSSGSHSTVKALADSFVIRPFCYFEASTKVQVDNCEAGDPTHYGNFAWAGLTSDTYTTNDKFPCQDEDQNCMMISYEGDSKVWVAEPDLRAKENRQAFVPTVYIGYNSDFNVLTVDYNATGSDLTGNVDFNFGRGRIGEYHYVNYIDQNELFPVFAARANDSQCDDMNVVVDFVKLRCYADVEPAMALGVENITYSEWSYSTPDPLDPQNSINSTTVNYSSSGSADIIERYWIEEDINFSTAQNPSRNYSSPGDYNVCFHWFSASDNELTCNNVDIAQYPQDVNFTWSPIYPYFSETVDFFGSGTDENTLSKWFWQSDGVYWDDSQNTSTSFASITDFNVCLTATDVDDLNTMNCYDVAVNGVLNIQFVDENTGAGVVVNVEVDDVDYSDSVDANGLFSLGLGGKTGTNHIVEAWSDDYGRREWLVVWQEDWELDLNFFMLDVNRGQDINFLIQDENGTVLSDVNVIVSNTGKYVSQKITDSEGRVQFFLNGNDVNYSYQVKLATGYLDFNVVVLNVKVPLAETNPSLELEPFNISVSGIGGRSFAASSTDVSFYVLPNTLNPYIINVDVNSEWISRDYAVSVEGRAAVVSAGPLAYIVEDLQPFLVSGDEGYLSWIYVYDESGSSLPGVLITVKKNIPGQGVLIVESKETDATGIALFSFVSLDIYNIEFYYNGSALLDEQFVPSLTQYYAYLNLVSASDSSFVSVPVSSGVLVDFLPKGSRILTPQSPYILSQIVQLASAAISIESINIYIVKDGNVLVDSNYSAAGTFTHSIVEDVNATISPVNVYITITTNQGVIVRETSYVVIFTEEHPYVFWNYLPNVKDDLGDFGALLISLFASVFVIGALAGTLGVRDTLALGVMFCLVLAVFASIGWINVFIWVMCCVFAGVIMIVSRRELQ